MSFGEGDPSEGLTLAEILGDDHFSPTELADTHTESQLRERIARLGKQDLDVHAQIARLESERTRIRRDLLLAGEALRIASDKGLE